MQADYFLTCFFLKTTSNNDYVAGIQSCHSPQFAEVCLVLSFIQGYFYSLVKCLYVNNCKCKTP